MRKNTAQPPASRLSRRRFLTRSAAGVAAPMVVSSRVFGANDRITMGAIGMGGRGRGDLGGFLNFNEIQVTAVCDVVGNHAAQAKARVDGKYKNTDCRVHTDFREITTDPSIDTVLIATPDHWHAIISIDAMTHGKDVFCEKPETLTIQEGQMMLEVARRFGRVFSGGSQRVWGDYNWYHKMIHGGRIGEVREAWGNVGGPSGPCYLPAVDKPDDVDWDRWLGPAPVRPFHPNLIRGGFRPYRDYSGGGMTDWGCHTFGGILFALKLLDTGPVEIIPPGDHAERLTWVYPNGVKIYHGGGWSQMSYRGTEGELPRKDKSKPRAPDIHIPNYKGRGGLPGDFLHCVTTRERPFRDIEVAHRTATHCHLGNLAYWLKRPLRWDPEKEEIIGDPEASRWINRPMREPWSLG